MIVIRDHVPSDLDFVYSSWLSNYQHSSYFARRIRKQTFMTEYSKILNALMLRDNVTCKIAGDDEFSIYGYIVSEPDCVHYVYVRPEYHMLGIAKRLITEVGLQDGDFEVSSWTPALNDISFKYRNMRYNPFRLLGV